MGGAGIYIFIGRLRALREVNGPELHKNKNILELTLRKKILKP